MYNFQQIKWFYLISLLSMCNEYHIYFVFVAWKEERAMVNYLSRSQLDKILGFNKAKTGIKNKFEA